MSGHTNVRRSTLAIALAGLTAGALDILYAIGFYATRDVPAIRILQSVASGLLGRDAYGGGGTTAALGLLLHCLITTMMAAAYIVASRMMPLLAQRPVLFGSLYGLLLYVIMNFVVVPLSAFPGSTDTSGAVLVGGLLAHTLLVGLPIALFARWAMATGMPADTVPIAPEAIGYRTSARDSQGT